LIFLCLKYFNEKVANKYRNKYLELNDQSYSVLLELKEKSVSEYFRSIHTAYLTERIANAVGCDVDAAKNCAYYHRIKKAFSYSLEDIRKFVKEHEFPPKAQETLLEYLSKSQKFDSREVCIVYITDMFISSLLTIFSKDSKAKVDYKDLIDTILNKDYVKKNISESRLTLNDLKLIREIVLRETLYYDFLR
jgi:membrane-associated HD superfamily phosphohydrolase